MKKGYYIDNLDKKTECLIKNIDWGVNPTNFQYKISENAKTQTANIKNIKEFGINNISKYNRATIKIDRSSRSIRSMSTIRVPVFKEEQLFLNVLVEGKANLYYYEDGNIRRFFYNKEDGNIEQLVFKSYKTSDNKIAKNERFKQQLLNNLKCATIKKNKIENLEYKKNSLINFFNEYNECSGSGYINYENREKKKLFNLSVRPRINSASLNIEKSQFTFRNTEFDTELSFAIGIEAEIILPFNKNKWGLILEPTYQSFKSEKEIINSQILDVIINTSVDYKSIEIPFGVRHYFFINKKSKIFINASFIIDVALKSYIGFNDRPTLKISSGTNFAFGLGYKYNDKYSLELRTQTNRDILFTPSSEYKTSAIVFGYTFF